MMQRNPTPVLDYPAFIPTDLTVEFCIEDCMDCMRACEQSAKTCLRGMPLTTMVVYRQLALECGDLAMRTARSLARGTDDAYEMCQLLTDYATAWARECDAFADDCFQACADACRCCATSCRDVLCLLPDHKTEKPKLH
jgi:hypothetical protein